MLILFLMIATTLMGIAIVTALVVGKDTAQPVALAALSGFVLAFPVSWLVARQIMSKSPGD